MDNREKTDAYVKGQMDQTERAAFQRDMLKDPALADAVDTTRTELQLANALVREQIQQWFQEWDSAQKPVSSQVPTPKRQTFPWLMAAALALFVVCLIWFVVSRQPTPITNPAPALENPPAPTVVVPPEHNHPGQADQAKADVPAQPKRPYYADLAREGFAYDAYQPLLRGAVPQRPEDTLQLAIKAMASGAIREAIMLASQIAPEQPTYPDAQLLLGQLCFRTGRYADAEKHLENALNSGAIGRDQPEWNLLMVYLARYPERQDETARLLQHMRTDSAHTFHREALILSQQLSAHH